MIIELLLLFYNNSGIRSAPPEETGPANYPIGALALACTAVRSALLYSVY
jgi:hypothetical protein